MIEKLKSFLLVLLISSSLLQSYLLAYSKPTLDPITETEFIETELLGEQQELSQMIHPEKILLHSPEKHTIMYQDIHFFDMIVEKVKETEFKGIREVSAGWIDQRLDTNGVEIYYKDGIPLTMLENFLQLEGEMFFSTDYINRIRITVSENNDEVHAFFYSVSDLSIYEATRVDLTARDVEQFIGFGEFLPDYEWNERYYSPKQSIEFIRYRLTYDQYTSEQFEKSLFVDPGISRKILERDGTEIITDGKRGLKIDREQAWLSYSDPVAFIEFGNDVRENLVSAVQFINRHGGWNGQFSLRHVPANRSRSFVFRQYFDALPILPPQDLNFGYMKIVLQKGLVSNYERSLLNMNVESATKELVTLPGGESLVKRIEAYPAANLIISLIPAYYPIITDEYIDLVPKWAVELTDGTYDYLP